jgi:hypothetical protein
MNNSGTSMPSLPVYLPIEKQVHLAILRHFIDSGKAPTTEEVRKIFSNAIKAKEITQILTELEKGCAINLVKSRSRNEVLISAYPFSALPTEFIVRVPSYKHSFYAMCAVDALGIPLMLKQEATIETKCHHCSIQMKIKMSSKGKIEETVPRGEKFVVSCKGAQHVCCDAAVEICPSINFYLSMDHAQDSLEKGMKLMTLHEALLAARKSFGRILLPATTS